VDLSREADRYWAAKDDRVDSERLDHLIALVPAGARVLVVDGGPGMLAKRLAERGFPVAMTEISAHAVGRALAKGLDARRADTDEEALPFEDGSFGCVISDSAIEHRYFPGRAVAECVRVLAPGGILVLSVPNIAHWRHRWWLLTGRFPEIPGGPTDPSHLRHFTLGAVLALVRSHGLRPVRVTGFPSLWVKGLVPRLFRVPGFRALYRGLCHLCPSLFARDVTVAAMKPPRGSPGRA
jgi:SAM-dependent methyltransferase